MIMQTMLPPALRAALHARAVEQAARAHASEAYALGREACGLVLMTPAGPVYRRCHNIANAADEFRIAIEEFEAARGEGTPIAVLHSHNEGPAHPSASDMRGQLDCDLPYGLMLAVKDAVHGPFYWGEALDPPKLLGRNFRHGPSATDGRGDCYALLRDAYRVCWGVVLQEVPRDDLWWKGGADLYQSNFIRVGFDALPRDVNPEAGDVFLARFQMVAVPHHAGIYLGNGLMIHHFPAKLSMRDPVGPWNRHRITHWLRYRDRPTRPFVLPATEDHG